MDLEKSAGSVKKAMKSGFLSMGWRQWSVLLLLGLLLAVAAMPVSEKEKRSGNGEEEVRAEQTELEKKLEEVLSGAEGVGKVRVILVTGPENGGDGFYTQENNKITGVLVSAEGADDPVTARNIQQAVMALFQVEAHKIKVMKMK